MIWKLFFEDFCVISGSTNSPPLKGRSPPRKGGEDYASLGGGETVIQCFFR